jgi:phage tail-like protein
METNRRNTILIVGALLLAVFALGLAVFSFAKIGGANISGSGLTGASGLDTTLAKPYLIRLECGKYAGIFQYFDGIGSSSEVTAQRVLVNGVESIVLVPGRLSYQTLTLRRALTSDRSFWEWRALVESGAINTARLNCSVTVQQLLDQKIVATWNLSNAWPSADSAPAVPDNGYGLGAYETLNLVFEKYTRTK